MPAASPYASRSGYRLAANLHAGMPGYQATRLFALDAKFSAECDRRGMGMSHSGRKAAFDRK